MDSSEIKPCRNGQLIFDKRTNNIQCKKDSLVNKQCRGNWIFTCKRIILDPYLTSLIKINLTWSKDLNVRLKTMKLLVENA